MKQRFALSPFRPAPLFDLAVCRLFIIGYQLSILGPLTDGMVSYTSVLDSPSFLYRPMLILQFMLFPFGAGYQPTLQLITIVYWVTVIACICALVGFRYKLSAWIMAIGSVFLHAHMHSYGEHHHPDALLIIALVLLAMSPAGKELSVDDVLAKAKSGIRSVRAYVRQLGEATDAFARWPLIVVRVLFGLVYLDAGLSKVQQAGMEWVNGFTLQYYLAQDAIRWQSSLGWWLSTQHELIVVMSWMAIIFELTFFLTVFIPRLRLIYVPMGVAFHTGIRIAMRANFLSYIMLYSVFVPWSRVLAYIKQRAVVGQDSETVALQSSGA